MIILAKIFSIILGLIVIPKAYLDFKKRRSSFVMFLFWTITWLVIISLSLYPILIEKISSAIGDNNSGVLAFLSMSLVFIFYVSYRVYVKASNLEKKLEDLVLKLGLRDAPKK